MKTLAFVILALVAGCATDDEDRYIVTQTDVPTGSGPASGGGTASSVSGRVCVATDVRALGSCATGGAGGFAVTLGGETTLTADDGSFTLPATTAADPTVTVMGTSATGLTIVPTTSPLVPGSTSVVVPAIDAELYQSILLANGLTLPDGTGSILATVSRGGLSASGVSVNSTPSGFAGTFYPGTSGSIFGTTGGTSTAGTVVIPGITAGTVDLSYETVLGGVETTVNGVTVRNGGITVLDTTLPSGGTP